MTAVLDRKCFGTIFSEIEVDTIDMIVVHLWSSDVQLKVVLFSSLVLDELMALCFPLNVVVSLLPISGRFLVLLISCI